MALRTIIIDDELDSLEIFQYKIKEYCPELDIIATSQSPEEGKELINSLNPDVVFLDVEMPRINGFRLLSDLGPITFDVVFTTAYSHYAIEAVRVSAFDYLTKPISIQDLERCVNRLIKSKTNNRAQKNTPYSISSSDPIIVIPTSDAIEFVKVAEILYLEASGNYTTFYIINWKMLTVAKTIGEFEELLLKHNFFRCHHSTLINLNYVLKYLRNDGGSILLSNQKIVPISRRKKDDFIDVMKRRSLN